MEIIPYHFDSIDSTNTWCKSHAHEFPLEKMILVTANTQTAGRGRFKRRWESPPGQNIYATFCFFVDPSTQNIGNIPQLLALSTASVLKKLDFNPELKWPNDILLSGKKVAGILAETTLVNKLCVIVGIGLNVNMPFDLLKQIDRPATSLFVESSQHYEIENILMQLQEQFSKNLAIFLSEGFAPFLYEYRQYLAKDPHKTIRFHDNRCVWEGKFHHIDDDGALCITLADGTLKTFIAGEILWPSEY